MSERTVYRYFSTERELREAVMDRLHAEAGTDYEHLTLESLHEVTGRVFRALLTFSVAPWTVEEPGHPFPAVDERRREALVAAVRSATDGWTEKEERTVAACLDIAWSVPSFERLVRSWDMEPEEAVGAIDWVMDLIVEAVRQDRHPSPVV